MTLVAACSRIQHNSPMAMLARTHRSHAQPVLCKAGSNGVTGKAPVKVNLKIGYRVNFGQSVGIVGANDILGRWDGAKAVKMAWTPGDYWVADLDVESGTAIQLEYKYVIINSDGRVGTWKPGANCKLDVLAARGTRVLVTDTWDDHGPRLVEVDVQGAEAQPAPAPQSPPHTQPQPQTPPSPQPQTASQQQPQPQAQNQPQPAEAPEPPPAPSPAAPAAKPPMSGIQAEALAAMGELEEALERQRKTMSRVTDPTSMEVILGDRLLAAANNKAVAMNRALKAAEALPALPAPTESKT
uniref:CBM20 domain-containing protein n=1 Tax=Chlamydomonas leiostraca TaxID=1034604 RepID=A0A7S0S1Z5_9CHLO|mmetsp:Transcript_4045/g.10091  ORF Transcript_4045/g.10091 Transcript_4045/m.10091 type:complete len:298 (+) Transcript_4045:93-986(+)